MKKNLQNRLEFWLVRGAIAVVRRMSWQSAQRIGFALGMFIYRFIPIRRSVARDNIRKTFPDLSASQVNDIVRRTYIQFARTMIEFMLFPHLGRDEVLEHVTITSPECMHEAFATDRGTVCVSGHFGNWELMAASIRAHGFPMSAIARQQRNGFIDQLIVDHRNAVGIETIPLGMALRNVLRALRKNRFVAILTDQDAHDEGVFVSFLGRPSSTAVGPAAFALKTGSPMLFGAAVRNPLGEHTVHLEFIPMDDLDPQDPESLSILTQRHAHALERHIRRHPDHWFWMHKRWKTVPRFPSPVSDGE